jgi:hypothetical protein
MDDGVMGYVDFELEKITDKQRKEMEKYRTDIGDIKKALSNKDMDEYMADFDIFIKFKDDCIDEAKKYVFGNTKTIVDLDDGSEVKFIGTVLNSSRCIVDPVELLNSIEPYIDIIFI